MNPVKNRAVAFGAAGALVAGSVFVGGMLSPASAATTSATYVCSLPLVGDTPLEIVSSMAIPAQVDPGESLSGLAASLGVTVPANLASALSSLYPQVNGTVTGASFPIQGTGTSIPTGTLAMPSPVAMTGGGDKTLLAEGSTGTANAPVAEGAYNVLMPSSFTFVPSTAGLAAIPCVTTAPATLGTLLVGSGGGGTDEKATTTTRAKFLNTPLTTAKRPLVRVRVVQADGDPAAGVVVVKKGKKVLKKVTLNDAGKKRFRFGALPRGEHRIVFKYKGDADSLASRVVKTVRVRRA